MFKYFKDTVNIGATFHPLSLHRYLFLVSVVPLVAGGNCSCWLTGSPCKTPCYWLARHWRWLVTMGHSHWSGISWTGWDMGNSMDRIRTLEYTYRGMFILVIVINVFLPDNTYTWGRLSLKDCMNILLLPLSFLIWSFQESRGCSASVLINSRSLFLLCIKQVLLRCHNSRSSFIFKN